MAKQLPAVFNWSGGKDSTLALHYILQQKEFEVRYLLTTINEAFDRVAMHGLRTTLLLEQVNVLRLPLLQVQLPEMPDMSIYEATMNRTFDKLKKDGIAHAIFGDIFLADLRAYREEQLKKVGMKTIFPLWQRDSLELVKEFIALGYKTIVVCAKEGLQDFCGRVIDHSFLADLPADVDPCGENGEFHTFVFDGPIFSKAVQFELGEKVFKSFPNPNQSEMPSGYWYVDLIPVV